MDIVNQNKDRRTRRKSSVDLSTVVYGKLPPQARELEEAVLGAVMLEKSAFDTIVEILKPECFYVDAHQRIFRTFQSLTQQSMPIDMLTVVEELKSKEFKSWTKLPHKGKGVSQFQEVTYANKWMRTKKGLSSTEWTQSIKMIGNVVPVKSIPGR